MAEPMGERADPLAVELPPALIDAIAERVADLLADRQAATADTGYLDVTAAAEFLSCPVSRVYALVSAGRIPHHRDGSRLLFLASELRTYIDDGGAKRP